MEAVDWAGPSVLPRWRPLIPLSLSSLPPPKLERLLKSGSAERSRCGLGWALGPSSLVFSASLSLSLSLSIFLSLSFSLIGQEGTAQIPRESRIRLPNVGKKVPP